MPPPTSKSSNISKSSQVRNFPIYTFSKKELFLWIISFFSKLSIQKKRPTHWLYELVVYFITTLFGKIHSLSISDLQANYSLVEWHYFFVNLKFTYQLHWFNHWFDELDLASVYFFSLWFLSVVLIYSCCFLSIPNKSYSCLSTSPL